MGTMAVLKFAYQGMLIAGLILLSGLRGWPGGMAGYFAQELLYGAILLLAAAYFARTETRAIFWKGFGLDRKPTDRVWFGIVCAVVIGGLSRLPVSRGWGNDLSGASLDAIRSMVAPDKFLYLALVLVITPWFEEVIFRGFLYKAFRGSYPASLSMVLLVAWTAWTHWPAYHHSWLTAVSLSALCVLLCYLREKSESLWDCVLTHCAFAASMMLMRGVL
jgi:membrane protease YdiL (CAAX protease family)